MPVAAEAWLEWATTISAVVALVVAFLTLYLSLLCVQVALAAARQEHTAIDESSLQQLSRTRFPYLLFFSSLPGSSRMPRSLDCAVCQHVSVLAPHHRWLVGGFVGYQDRVLSAARQFWRTQVPVSARSRINALRRERREASWRRPRKLGELRRARPFTTWGADRGGSIPRFYIAEFLQQHAEDIHGRVLEVAGDRYIRQFGKGVSHADILDIRVDNPRATFVGDFADAPNVPANTFDCLVVTQILSWVYDLRAPFQTAHRLLVPGGVFLATTPGIARLAPIESKLFGEWWHFTSMAAKRVGEEVFGVGNVEVQAFGNVLAAAGTLSGLGRYDLSREELAFHDPAFEVIVAVRAVKPQ